MRFVKIILGIVLLAGVALLLIGVFVPEIQYEVKVKIDRPRQEVFEVFNSRDAMPHWIEGFKSMELVRGEQGKNGATYRMTVMDRGREHTVTQNVVKQIEAELCEYLVSDDHMTNKVIINFTDADGGTEVQVSKYYKGRDLLTRSFLPLLQGSLRDVDVRQFGQLKIHIEHR